MKLKNAEDWNQTSLQKQQSEPIARLLAASTGPNITQLLSSHRARWIRILHQAEERGYCWIVSTSHSVRSRCEVVIKFTQKGGMKEFAIYNPKSCHLLFRFTQNQQHILFEHPMVVDGCGLESRDMRFDAIAIIKDNQSIFQNNSHLIIILAHSLLICVHHRFT